MRVSFIFFTGLALAALPAAAQVQVQTKQVGPTSGSSSPATGAPAPQPTPAPCPGMAGLEIGQTRAFSFERMALHEPAKKTVTRELKVVHTPAGRPWTVDVTYASDALDAKVVALHYLLDPPSGLYEGILERYGKGTPVASEPGMSSWDVPFCVGATSGVRLRYRMGMSDKQRRVEELWVEPLTARNAAARKR
ncbi:MAG: hypothetical protein ACXVID_07600 [Thermoanaerobaculia bacterium]